MAKQSAALGLPPEMAAAMLAASPREPEAVEIMPENWPVMRLFLAMETQWRRVGMSGVPTGLDYAALAVVAGALAIGLDADLMARLRVVEGAALAAMLEMHARD